jgi:hypothetical protein
MKKITLVLFFAWKNEKYTALQRKANQTFREILTWIFCMLNNEKMTF